MGALNFRKGASTFFTAYGTNMQKDAAAEAELHRQQNMKFWEEENIYKPRATATEEMDKRVALWKLERGEEFTIRGEGRAEERIIGAEGRAEERTIGAEERQLENLKKDRASKWSEERDQFKTKLEMKQQEASVEQGIAVNLVLAKTDAERGAVRSGIMETIANANGIDPNTKDPAERKELLRATSEYQIKLLEGALGQKVDTANLLAVEAQAQKHIEALDKNTLDKEGTLASINESRINSKLPAYDSWQEYTNDAYNEKKISLLTTIGAGGKTSALKYNPPGKTASPKTAARDKPAASALSSEDMQERDNRATDAIRNSPVEAYLTALRNGAKKDTLEEIAKIAGWGTPQRVEVEKRFRKESGKTGKLY